MTSLFNQGDWVYFPKQVKKTHKGKERFEKQLIKARLMSKIEPYAHLVFWTNAGVKKDHYCLTKDLRPFTT